MSARSVTELTGFLAAGVKVKYLQFWGHQPQRDGSIADKILQHPDLRGYLPGFALTDARAVLRDSARR